MTILVRIGIAASMLGVCTRTIRRWDAAGMITCTRTLGGHRRVSLAVIEGLTGRFSEDEDEPVSSRPAVYCRVSSHEQKAKGDLARQVVVATRHCTRSGLGTPLVFTDVASGLNAMRPGLARLCKEVESRRVHAVVVSFKDRLTRFGFEYLRRYFASHGTTIHVARQLPTRTMHDELVEDLIAIVTSFSGRVHGLRGRRGKDTVACKPSLDPCLKPVARAVTAASESVVDALVREITASPLILSSPAT